MTSRGGAVAVIIATRGRPALVTEIVGALDGQSRRPDHIFIVGCSDGDLSLLPSGRPDLTTSVGRTGLTLQRNDGLRLAGETFGALAFFDDDFWPSRFWLENALALFDGDPSIAGLTGRVLADGIGGPGLSLAEARKIVAARDGEPSGSARFDESFGPYGCNMVFRAEAIIGMAFDERLPLYGWLEDADFGERLRRRGKMGRADTLWGVHLGARGGREKGLRLGYSQIANAFYLARKGSLGWRFAARRAMGNLAANLLRFVAPEPHIDRRGRLVGNLLALGDLAVGRVTPERAADL
jgi:hypothetical protein